MSQGWISLHRKIEDNFLWKQHRVFSKAEAWIDILLQVNHKPEEVLLGNTLIICDRGQSIKSLETWQKRWNWRGKKQVRDFLMLLQSQSMLRYESVTKSIRITVCNYDTYQQDVNDKETQNKRKVNAKETQNKPNNNDNNENNENNIKEEADASPKNDFIDLVIKEFQDLYKRSRGVEFILTNRGKERKAVASLLNVLKTKNPDTDSEGMQKIFRQLFEQSLAVKESWHFNNMSPSHINSKLNEIRELIRGGNNATYTSPSRSVNPKGGATAEDIADVIRQRQIREGRAVTTN